MEPTSYVFSARGSTEPLEQQISNWIAQWCKNHHISLAALISKAGGGISDNTISAVIHGLDNVQLRAVIQVALALGMRCTMEFIPHSHAWKYMPLPEDWYNYSLPRQVGLFAMGWCERNDINQHDFCLRAGLTQGQIAELTRCSPFLRLSTARQLAAAMDTDLTITLTAFERSGNQIKWLQPERPANWDNLSNQSRLESYIIAWRELNHLSQMELSILSGVDEQRIHCIELSFGDPTIGELKQIASAMDTVLIFEGLPKELLHYEEDLELYDFEEQAYDAGYDARVDFKTSVTLGKNKTGSLV